MKNDNRNIGRIGEQLAENFLLKKGYELIERNFSTKFGEIDLIMQDGDVLVFVEVKTKTSLDFGTPEEMFTPGKKRRVHNMGVIYLKGREVKCRIDMVAVELTAQNEVRRLSHYPNV